jgi:hypothetical protein
MTLCPVAIVAGCNKCPVFSICPLKGVIGNHRKEEDSPKPSATPAGPPGKPAK